MQTTKAFVFTTNVIGSRLHTRRRQQWARKTKALGKCNAVFTESKHFLWKVIHEIRTTINSPTFRGPFVAVEGIFVDEMTKKLEKVENYSLLKYAEMHKNTRIIRISWTANPQK